jgi:hypothetical protein
MIDMIVTELEVFSQEHTGNPCLRLLGQDYSSVSVHVSFGYLKPIPEFHHPFKMPSYHLSCKHRLLWKFAGRGILISRGNEHVFSRCCQSRVVSFDADLKE